ncbi:hypothetical protein AMTR_s00040p00066920 [Amborella trichopoda]|uniref:FAD-binding domain-containing protein n=2 Tax=Amborella trichopoda TaxID=13333 RepID=W1PY57_AMBTC|nr:hypothetical protein AMTR_s00040p00066920 [Amborella trichopoda]
MARLGENFPSKFLEIIANTDLSTLTLAPLKFRWPWDLIFRPASRANLTVPGDAMHPMTRDLAQGGCSALEDAVVLGRHLGGVFLKKHKFEGKEVEVSFKNYVKERKWRAAGLILGSLLSRWVQGDDGWWLVKAIRHKVFYGLLYSKLFNVIDYDCRVLPAPPSYLKSGLERQTEAVEF